MTPGIDPRVDALEKGREEGQWIGRIQMGQDLLGIPITPSVELISLSISELQARAKSLEEQLRSRSV